MSRLLIAAISGWGKGYVAQAIINENLADVEYAVIMDYSDEYRGLVKAGKAKHAIVGPRETALSADQWEQVIRSQKKIVLAKHQLTNEDWRQVVGRVVSAMRRIRGSSLTVIDEAHFVAPQQGSFPESIKELATSGRSDSDMSIWITQRMAEIEETIIAQAIEQVIGGFKSKNDRDKLDVEYDEAIHNPSAGELTGLPDELLTPEGDPIPLRRFEDDDEKTIGSEWVFSDDKGTIERWNTKTWNPPVPHHGAEGAKLAYPGGE